MTIPHKESVLQKLTKFDPAVKGIGAANTLVFEGEDLIGYNTDFPRGDRQLGTARGHNRRRRQHGGGGAARGPDGLKGKTACCLGAGGAARAMAYGLKKAGASVVISRPDVRSGRMQWRRRWSARRSIGTTGMAFRRHCRSIAARWGCIPNVDETPYDKNHLHSVMVVFDMVYNPENTLLIKEARSQGCAVVTGVEMFVRQASLQFKLFTGQDAPWELMRDTLKRAIGPAKMWNWSGEQRQ